MSLSPTTIEEVQELVRSTPKILPRGGGTKWSFAGSHEGAAVLDTRGLSGVVEYDPAEYTLTARAGTPLGEIEALLAGEGQYLPFDPPFVRQGATVGGTVSSGLSGPCRLRYGGLRDFVLGVRLVDGEGNLVRGGGKVVKNAAGFDLPKLFCGSRGRLGVLVEVTLKVFPRPEAFATLRTGFTEAATAAGRVRELIRGPLAPHAVDLLSPGVLDERYTVLVRVGGLRDALGSVLDRVEKVLGRTGERLLEAGEEGARWERLRDLEWAPPGAALLRIHTLPDRIEGVDALLSRFHALRQFSLGGNLAWAAFPSAPDWQVLAAELAALQAVGVVFRGGPPEGVYLNGLPGAPFARRIKSALDPAGRFGPIQ